MKSIRLEVVYRSDDYTKSLQAELAAARGQIKALQAKITQLESHYYSLYYVDMQLADLLRVNGIPYRDISGVKDPYWQ